MTFWNSARPIYSTIEIFAGVDSRSISSSPGFVGLPGLSRGILRVTIRIATLVVIIVIAIFFPAFDSIMAFMGSALCFTICIVLPCAFHLKIFGDKISMKERMLNWFLIVICSILALIGTAWAFLPKDMILAKWVSCVNATNSLHTLLGRGWFMRIGNIHNISFYNSYFETWTQEENFLQLFNDLGCRFWVPSSRVPGIMYNTYR